MPVEGTMNSRWCAVLLSGLLLALPRCSDSSGGNGNGNNDCVPSQEIPDNEVDEDCDGWLDTSVGVRIRATHPRVLVNQEQLDEAIDRCTGPNARDPYARWFNLIKDTEDGGESVDLANLAFLYKATGDSDYLDRFVGRIPESGDPGLTELLALDLVWDDVSDSVKRTVMRRVSENADIWYWNSINQSNEQDASWGYHSAHGVAPALAYAGAFALTPVELNKDPADYPFNALNYIYLVSEELSDEGHFRRIENRVAGDPTYNDALPGSFGGMYDNIGYDSSEESYSVNVLAEFYFLTGEDRYTGFLHDEQRAAFYQNLQYPHLASTYTSDQWCRRAGTESHIIARIWNTQTDWISQPRTNAVSLTAWLYQDPRMQYYKNNGVQRELCGSPYDGMFWDLLFYHDSLSETPPSDNPQAMYFNGPGLVSMRENWTNDAAFAVFIAGEGISRRYEDANSFILHRKADVIPHGGARIRNNPDNSKHHWYHIRSIAKNTLKIIDPDECLDLDADSNRGPFHSGPSLVPSDNFGGQLFETATSENDGDFTVYNGGATPSRTSSSSHPLGLYEVANVTKFEHVQDAYTYTVGDGTAAYTRKIDFFEREFVYLRPDVFVVFDRVQTVDPSFKKVWVIHTVDEPVTLDATSDQGQGMRTYTNSVSLTISNPRNVTYIDALLPEDNRVVIRGGDTELAAGVALRPSSPIGSAQIRDSEIPRWLELFAVGPDIEGTVTITGDALEGNGINEDIVFDGTVQEYVNSVPTGSVTATELPDDNQNWQSDQWQGYMVHIRCGGDSETVVITGNDATRLFGSFTPCSQSWAYTIQRPLANAYNHWTRITSITTADMDVDHFTVSIPHYFDTVDAIGRLHTFAPHTDSRDDGYRKRRDLGQWTVNIEADGPALLDNFLNVIILKDPGQPKPVTALIGSAEAAGAVVGTRFVIFARERNPLASYSVDIPQAGVTNGLVFDLQPDTLYYHSFSAGTLTVSTTDVGGQSGTSSAMGVLAVTL